MNLRTAAALLNLTLLALITAPAAGAERVLPATAPETGVAVTLRSLRENEAVILGKAKVVGELNATARRYELEKTGPRARNYSLKMAWAPERGRALYVGANHAVPHRLNDVWEFDLASLSWILLYAPDFSRSYKGLGDDASDVRFKEGVLVTERGGPAIIGHTWWGMSYDTDERRLLFVNVWLTDQPAAIASVGGDPEQRYRGIPLWSYTPQTGRWSLIRSSPPMPRIAYGAMLEYIDTLHGAIWHSNNWQMRGTWLFDTRSNRWKDLRANSDAGDFKLQAPSREQVGYYDPRRGIVVALDQLNTYHFDVKAAQWRRVLDGKASAEEFPNGHDARTVIYFDPKSGHGLLIDFRTDALWAYDPEKLAWKRLSPQGVGMPTGKKKLAYIDPMHNVLVVIDDLTVWAYRYRL